MADADAAALVARLAAAPPLSGPSRGGPFVGLQHSDLTRAILAAGQAAVPPLLARLADCGFDEAARIVFLLRELRAAEARPAIERLRADIARRSAGRDMTLRMQVEYFLRDAPPG